MAMPTSSSGDYYRVILNQVASDRHLELLETALNSIEMPVLGVLRRNADLIYPIAI